MVIQYKCPNCGADMAYDSDSGKLHCDSCGTTRDIQEMPHPDIPEGEMDDSPSVTAFSPEEVADEEDFDIPVEPTSPSMLDSQAVSHYHCGNCGADIITDNDTVATTCSFCGAAVVLSDRLTGELAPAKVIPFRISKEQAQTAFMKWCKKGLLLPKSFKNSNRQKSITGIYVPFWLYDIQAKGDVDATCTKVRSYASGDYIYTETSYYHVYRRVNVNYVKVPADASDKMDDTLMDRLEPFNYQEMKDFNMPYLAGYVAEKYNFTDEEMFPRAKERVEHYANQFVANSISGYSSVHYNRKDLSIRPRAAYYTLMPIWMFCYDYRDSEHIFAMNGQTGKIVGRPPLSKGKIAAWFAGISAGVFAVLQLVTRLFLWK